MVGTLVLKNNIVELYLQLTLPKELKSSCLLVCFGGLVCDKARAVENCGSGWNVCVQNTETSSFDSLTLFDVALFGDSINY